MRKETYQGWTNYETWNVSLWFDNDRGMYDYWQQWIVDCCDHLEPGELSEDMYDVLVYDLQLAMKDFVDENNPLQDDSSMYADMLNAAISEVNWYEIAESYVDAYLDEMNYKF